MLSVVFARVRKGFAPKWPCVALALAVLFGTLCGPTRAFGQNPLDYPAVSQTDLTTPFRAKGNWRFVATQEPSQGAVDGDLHFCFVHDGRIDYPDVAIHFCDRVDGRPACSPGVIPEAGSVLFKQLESVSTFQPPDSAMTPLLVVAVSANWGGPGSDSGLAVYRYRVDADRFDELFEGTRASNGGIRLVTNGPLAGDIIAGEPGDRAHRYSYKLTVYKLQRPERYVKVLEYFGATKYHDGNRLSVIDGEMPEIERRLGVWKPGDALPVPRELPSGCRIELRNGVEWCADAQK